MNRQGVSFDRAHPGTGFLVIMHSPTSARAELAPQLTNHRGRMLHRIILLLALVFSMAVQSAAAQEEFLYEECDIVLAEDDWGRISPDGSMLSIPNRLEGRLNLYSIGKCHISEMSSIRVTPGADILSVKWIDDLWVFMQQKFTDEQGPYWRYYFINVHTQTILSVRWNLDFASFGGNPILYLMPCDGGISIHRANLTWNVNRVYYPSDCIPHQEHSSYNLSVTDQGWGYAAVVTEHPKDQMRVTILRGTGDSCCGWGYTPKPELHCAVDIPGLHNVLRPVWSRQHDEDAVVKFFVISENFPERGPVLYEIDVYPDGNCSLYDDRDIPGVNRVYSITPTEKGVGLYGEGENFGEYFVSEYIPSHSKFFAQKMSSEKLFDSIHHSYGFTGTYGYLLLGKHIARYNRTLVETSVENPDDIDLDVNIYLNPDVQFYPNPVTDFVTFNNLEWDATITVYDMLGRQILTATDSRVDLSSLPAGMYVWIITSGTERITGKLVKR